MFAWLKNLFSKATLELEPLPPLGFTVEFLDLYLAAPGTVIVSMENDDETPMEFVVQVIRDYFGYSLNESTRLMLKIHTEGTCDIRALRKSDAEHLVSRVREQIRQHGHPLTLSIRETKKF